MKLDDAVRNPDRRVQLEGLRDFLVNELEGNKCRTCNAVKLRASDTAALVRRLMVVLEELHLLPSGPEEVDPVDALQAAMDDLDDILSQDTPRQSVRKTRKS